MRQVRVGLGARSYPIMIGHGLLTASGSLSPHVQGKQVLVVTNERVAPLYLQKACAALEGKEIATLVLPDGERYKTLTTLNDIFDVLIDRRFDRGATLVALGGGVIGDLTGFAAACYQRGIDFIQIPTTLVAQVDSSVGGKTGVNHPRGKNMIGAFHQPRCVLADTATLETLPERELRAGLAEVIKYGLMADAAFFAWLEQNMEMLLARSSDALTFTIERCCQLKAGFVEADERESGERALLNLGHTFGHAIEAAQDYQGLLHGEAVAAGMAMAANCSAELGWLSRKDYDRTMALLTVAGLPTGRPPELNPNLLRQLMASDKKVAQGKIRLVLLEKIGTARLTADYPESALVAALEQSAA